MHPLNWGGGGGTNEKDPVYAESFSIFLDFLLMSVEVFLSPRY